MKKIFAYHTPTAETQAKIQEIRQAFSSLYNTIEASCPPSRERSVALTELETSAMWAIKSIVVNDPASTVEEQPTRDLVREHVPPKV